MTMAITLDELLGMNSKTKDEVTYDSFPQFNQYNEIRSGRGRTVRADEEQRRFNGYTVVQNNPRSEENIRAYEASRPYELPRTSEYQSGADRGFEQMRRRGEANVRPAQDYGYKDYSSFAHVETRENSFHDFARQDNERPSDRELFDRLSASSAMTATPSARVEEHSYEKTSSFAPAKKSYKSESTKKARLNTKAKVLLAVYFAVIILVAVLIIVNAGNLNNGTATTPSSSITGVVQDSAVSHISDASSIDFDYDAAFNIK